MDLLIKNAVIIDGTGRPRYNGSIGINEGKIVTGPFSETETADVVIDANGKYLTPGFIDCHSHGDMVLGDPVGDLCKVNQGFTTHIAGQCGDTMAPVSEKCLQERENMLRGLTTSLPAPFKTWNKWSAYADYVETLPMALNIKLFVGYNSIRASVMGYEDRKPIDEEIRQMQALLVDAMEHGAVGMSSGLAYIPGTFSTTEELAEVAKAMAPYNGIYATHIRNESHKLIPAVKEALDIGRIAGVSVNISHFKAKGRPYWGKVMEAAALIDEARKEGLNVTVDQYPYNRTMTQLYPSIPPWHFTEGVKALMAKLSDPELRKTIRAEMNDPASNYENMYLNAGGFDGITVCSALKTPQFSGKTISEIAEETGNDPFDTFFDLLIGNEGIVTAMYHSIGDEDIYNVIRLPYAMVGTDGIVRERTEYCHPRGWGSMVRAIIEFTKNHPVLTLEELVHKNTRQAAERYRLAQKGEIRDGYDADLVLFDYEGLKDNADYRTPYALASGIEAVFVGGKIVYKDGALTGEKPGKLLRDR